MPFVRPASVEPLFSAGGRETATVATGAANTVISASPGRLCRIMVTTTGTGTASPGCLFYDNATTNSGTIIFAVPGNAAQATFYDVSMPVQNGIVAANILNGPVLTVSFT